jgi:hypothetical protein
MNLKKILFYKYCMLRFQEIPAVRWVQNLFSSTINLLLKISIFGSYCMLLYGGILQLRQWLRFHSFWTPSHYETGSVIFVKMP